MGIAKDILIKALDNIPDHICLINNFGKIIYVNEMWKDFSRQNNGDKKYYIGTNYLDNCGDELKSIIQDIINGNINEYYFDYPCISKDNEQWFLCKITKLDSNYTLINHSNITEQKLTEYKADLSEKARAKFLASMSHELRTPLNAIIGFSDLMKMVMPQDVPEKIKEYPDFINGAGRHLLGLLDDILDLSKLEATVDKLNIQTANIHDLIKDVLHIIDHKANQKNIKITTRISCPVNVKIDSRRIKQVLINFLTNSIKYSNENKEITIIIKESDNLIVFSVIDQGIGMDKDELVNAQQPFVRLDNVGNEEGLGLGLAISKKLIELHGGHFHVLSRKNHGTSVLFSIPKYEYNLT